MMKFTPVIGLKSLKPHKTLESAFREFHRLLTEQSKKGPLPVAWLNGCWIESTNKALPYFFDDIVALAHDQGWLVNGKLSPPRTVGLVPQMKLPKQG